MPTAADRLLQHPAGRADERDAALILDVAGLLADQHDLGDVAGPRPNTVWVASSNSSHPRQSCRRLGQGGEMSGVSGTYSAAVLVSAIGIPSRAQARRARRQRVLEPQPVDPER